MRADKKYLLLSSIIATSLACFAGAASAQTVAQDPGVRGGDPGAGGALPGLPAQEFAFFADGLADFSEAEGVGDGLGPRFNLDGCAGCHSQPATGGTAGAINPQVDVATFGGARNVVPSFITATGPIREARFKFNPDGTRDGGVHALFVISGRVDDTGDATGCNAVQENFATQVNNNNVVFRIPTPVFGAGLIEGIPDTQINASIAASSAARQSFGIFGHLNRITGSANNNGNDGTIARFGWKAQNKSMLLFSGEAYNVEMGISNELFNTEREENATCQFRPVPNDTTNFGNVDDNGNRQPGTADGTDVLGAIEKFANFMRFLAAPTPSATTPGGSASIARGRQRFTDVGCNLCHTPSFTTQRAFNPALDRKPVNVFSDLAVHHMGPGLADNVMQGEAGPDEFRSAPLWGLGQRIFLLHDGRTKDLRTAILAHRSNGNSQFPSSEANTSVNKFDALDGPNTQDLFNFLRSL